MNPFAAVSLLTFVVNVGLGFFVYSRDTQSRVHRLFMFFSLTVAYWGLTEFGYRQADSYAAAILWMKMSSLCPFVVAAFLHFVLAYTKNRWLRSRGVLWAVYLPAAVFVVVDLPTSWISGTPTHAFWGWTYLAAGNFWYDVNALWLIALLLVSVGLCVLFYRQQTDPAMRAQTGFVALGLTVPVASGALTEVVVPFLGIRIPELTSAGFAVANAFIGYAMWRHELFRLSPRAAADRIIDTMTDALFILDSNGTVQESNQAALRMLGCDRQALVGRKVRDVIVTPGSANDRTDGFPAELRDVEAELRKCDGMPIPVSVSSATMHDKRGQPRGAILIARDITERHLAREALQKAHDNLEARVLERTAELDEANRQLHQELSERRRAESALAEEKERLDVTLRSIGDGVITTDTQGVVVLLSDAATDLTGWPREVAVGRPVGEVFRVVDELTRAPIPDPVAAIVHSEGVVELLPRAVLIARDGSERRIADSGAPIRDAQGRIVGAVIVFRDVTEKQRLEDELLKAKKLESVGQLAGGIAHDFNNLLTAIINNLLSAKLEMRRDEKAYRLIQSAEEAAFRASKLTKQLLTFAGGGEPVRQVTPLGDLIEDSVGFALSGSSVDYSLDIADDLLLVDIDKGQIDQVLNSLVTNAAQAMPGGGAVTVTARNVTIGVAGMVNERGPSQRLAPGVYVKVSVADQGGGIPPERLERIFDPFFSTKEGSSGMGLAAAYSIVKKHDGYVTVTSEVGQGSVFSIYLPASPEGRAPTPLAGADGHTGGEARILLMDDEPAVRHATAGLLTRLGYVVETTANGREALDAYGRALEEDRPFAGAILDLTVPGGMGGKECMLYLLRLDPKVKAIVTSGYSTSDVMAQYRVFGFRGVLGKPYSVEQLSEAVRRLVSEE